MKLNYENCGRISQALAFTVHIHHDLEGTPEFYATLSHAMEAAEIARVLGEDEDVQIAALLHDIPERYPHRMPLVKQCFGAHVAALCTPEEELPRSAPLSDSWQRRKLFSINRLSTAAHEAKAVVLADKLSTLRAYSANPELLERRPQNPTLLHWYYSSVLLSLGEFANTSVYAETNNLIKTLF